MNLTGPDVMTDVDRFTLRSAKAGYRRSKI
jgi:hypothetical protein